MITILRITIVCLVALSLCVVNAEVNTDKAKHYIVGNGDSIEKIAAKFKVLPWQLRKANGMSPGVVIHPGQEIKIPQPRFKTYEGFASWYGPGFHGKKMANGKRYDQNAILVAHRTLPLESYARITNLLNGKSAIVPVLDRGPYAKDADGNYTREVDLSLGLAKFLGAVKIGIIPVRIEPLNNYRI